ncbi:hypothetical protein G9A89_020111 [Geosiphon pyriformis]|nr:hypothetical protein G9A89_020111 [Geosiphon pyriformis]
MTTNPPPNYLPGDIGYVLFSTALVWIMIPGIGFFYSGMARSKNALSLIMLSMLSIALVSFQWWAIGFSLTFSKTANKYSGNFRNVFFINVKNEPSITSHKIPDLVFAIYQSMFAAITPALVIGAAAERARILPTIIFILVWTTLVYDTIACWTWNPNGWANKMGTLDFAGGTPVHIASGSAALAYSMILGKRHGYRTDEFKPHNVAHVVLGCALLWFGWFGFNGGSALGANSRAAMAFTVTNLAASVGGLTWMFLDYRLERKFSALSFCSGAIAGLVTITPGAGFVSAQYSVVFGLLGGFLCNFAAKLKDILEFDDALDVFAVHAVGGIVGNLLTGVFAQRSMATIDGDLSNDIRGGWLEGNWQQIGYQAANSFAGFTYSFCATYIILIIINRIPGLKLRVNKEAEYVGLDESQCGEVAHQMIENLVFVDPKRNSDSDTQDEPKIFMREEILTQVHQIHPSQNGDANSNDSVKIFSEQSFY